jgi:hypothetical protein
VSPGSTHRPKWVARGMTTAPAEPDPDPDDEQVPAGEPDPGDHEPDVMQPLDEPPD